jgi:pantothenate kinase type III
MKNLVIDIGNSRIKSALFGEDRLLTLFLFDHWEETTGTWYLPMQKPAWAIDLGTCKTQPQPVDASNAYLQVDIWSGISFEMEGFNTAHRDNFPEISVYLCGGGAESFDSFPKDHIFVVPNLVPLGLNCILNHHVA